MDVDPLPVERWFRPIALFALATVISVNVVGFGSFLSDRVGDFSERYSWILNPIMYCGVFAAISSIVVAVYIASHDGKISAATRTRWMLAILITNMFGGPLFIVVRWYQQQRHRRTTR